MPDDFLPDTQSKAAPSEPTSRPASLSGPSDEARKDPASTTHDDPFCVHPWMHFRIQGNGEAVVCCRYRNTISEGGSPLSLRTHSFDELWNSGEMRDVRRDMVLGKRVAGCADCYDEETNGAVSMRMRDNAAWQNGWLNEARISIEDLKSGARLANFSLPALPANLEVDTGSLCNLKCRMCHDGVSSRIATDVVHRSWATDQYADKPYHDPQVIVRPSGVTRWSLSKALEDAIVGAPDQVRRLYFIGGEPLLVKEVGDLLRRLIDAGISRNMMIAVVSNGTVTGSWLELIPHFKGLELAISIDGFGKQYDYIRYPSKWEKLVRNLSVFRGLPNVSLGAAITLQFYNALNICDLFRYCDSIDLGFFAWPVHMPRYLSVEAMPPAARRLASARLRAYAEGDCRPAHRDVVFGLAEHLRPTSDAFDTRLLRDCMLFTNDLDVSRGQSFAETNQELLNLLAQAGLAWTTETLHARRDGVLALVPGQL
jgi:MoaA/NifB/PqqE/SkfB family radical SAM enzyme